MVEPGIRIEVKLVWLTLICVCLVTGCREPNLSTEYGKITGVTGSDSINGTSVLADMFLERGFTVKRRRKISPQINGFGTIVWFPDDYSCPSSEAVTALTQWLEQDSGRTLIYVGRDYDSRTDYLSEVLMTAPVEQKEELLRQIAEGRYIQARLSHDSDIFSFEEDTTQCEWFELERVKRRKTNILSGSLTSGVTLQTTEIELSTILRTQADEQNDWSPRTLLDADGLGFVVELNSRSNSGSRLILVSNGSFLLNFALVDQGHRQLASNLIDQCDPTGGVVFLESGTRGIEVSDTDKDHHNNWAWIAQPPLRYIVPHFLMWGILFCLVFFPIFGRPKRIKKRNTSTFRAHINAMGKLIARSDQPNRAIDKIREYQHLASGESRRNRPDQ